MDGTMEGGRACQRAIIAAAARARNVGQILQKTAGPVRFVVWLLRTVDEYVTLPQIGDKHTYHRVNLLRE